MYKRLNWIGLAAIIILFFGCGGNSSNGNSNGSNSAAKWTYMVYIAGDNNLAASAVKDINEMEKAGSNSDVNIVVQVENSKDYTPDMPSYTMRGKIAKDNDFKSISSKFTNIGKRDMGSKKELTEFIKWATSNYPADHYALVLWITVLVGNYREVQAVLLEGPCKTQAQRVLCHCLIWQEKSETAELCWML